MRPAHLTPSSFAACLAALLLMVSIPASSWAIFGFFEKNKDKDSDPDARASQENAALALYNQATTVELAKNYGKARDIYRQVVHDFPTTNAAAQSQFKAAEMFELEGKEKKAFDAYQLFISDYKGSSLFMQAVDRQFNIVQTARNNKKKKILGIGGGSSISSTEQVEMLDKIALNAPFSKYAPEARFVAAEIQRESKEYDLAILQYQTFVREYPADPKAPAAQYQVARLLQDEAASANNDSSQLGLTRNAYEEVLIQFPDSSLITEVRQKLSDLEQQELKKYFDIAKFYEKTDKYQAAVIYYRRVTSHPNASDFEAAKTRLDSLRESHPEAFAERGQMVAVEAKTDVKSRDDYVGPPNLAALSGQNTSKIRNAMDDVAPAPIVEPDLPDAAEERPQEQPSPGLLLPPITPTGEALRLPPAAPVTPTTGESSSPSTAKTGSQE